MKEMEMSKDSKYVRENLTKILQAYNIPPSTIRLLREAFMYDAVQQARDFKYDRIYCCIGLSLFNVFGFGARRIIKLLTEFDRLCGAINGNEQTWEDVMRDLHKKVGLLVRTDEDNRLILEYEGKGE